MCCPRAMRVNDGQPRISLADYEKNLRALVARLQRTGARLIFATTTPVPAADVRPVRRNADAVSYNEAARKIMSDAGVAIDDLHAIAAPRLAEIQQPANVHFTPAGYRALAEPVAAAIRDRLGRKSAEQTAR